MIILGIIGIISLPNSCQFLHHHGVFVCFAYKITGIEGVALLIYGDLLFSQNRPFHRCFHLSIQNGQNGLANGLVFICMLPPLSLTLHAK